ncbi:3-deoxy-8-phosphooctulonate synthase [Lysinibacillus xylanilyticus]|uniref:3-deoxy-8-phosphooctulonate synthase n=1 Tax=Lysinibacillus xylanilyticus TaxID=582475 RepID=UPI0037F987C2
MEPLVYRSFSVVKETEADGFIYGDITDHFYFDTEEADGCLSGDGFVQAPDGSRAGIVWELDKEPFVSVILEREEDRWGVYNVGFVKPIKTMDDLIFNFRTVLPLLKEAYHDAQLRK